MFRMLLLGLLLVASCQAAMNDTELLCYMEELIDSDDWGNTESTPIIAGENETELESRDPLAVLSQFNGVELISVGEQNLVTFLGSEQANFIGRLDQATADDLIHKVYHRLHPEEETIICGESTERYRTLDGSCNNPEHPEWGMANRPFGRFLSAAYDDGKKAPRKSTTGQDLPSAREVSVAMTEDGELVASRYSALNVHFGQLLSHDLDHAPVAAGKCSDCKTSDICLPIPIPPNDPVFTDQECIKFVRSVGAPSGGGDQPWAHQQLNRITSYLDASIIYGSSIETLNALREPRDPQGLMRVTPSPVPQGKDLLPPDDEIANCAGREGQISCGKAGDSRAAEQAGLTVLHTVWLREHNRVARELSRLNPHWGGDRTFSEARKIVAAEWQHVIYNEYLPLLVGRRVAKQYGLDVNIQDARDEYEHNAQVDATILNGFASAAFRLGHSQVPTTIWRVNEYYERVFSDIKMREAFFNATHVYDFEGGGPGSIVRGMLVQPLDRVDQSFSASVTKHLFEDPKKGFGLDLVSLNIQRGRDHGLPGYVRYREDVCGLDPIRNWADLSRVMAPKTARWLRSIYSSVEDIDAFVGFFAELHEPGALVGPTLACLNAFQFSALKYGDRFWYENTEGEQALSAAQQKEIRKVTMARVLCDNTEDMKTIQPFAFLMADEDDYSHMSRKRCQYVSFAEYSQYRRYPNRRGRLRGFCNYRASCRDELNIPRMNLNAWAEY